MCMKKQFALCLVIPSRVMLIRVSVSNQALEDEMVVSIIKPRQQGSWWRQCTDLLKSAWGLEEGRRGREKEERNREEKGKQRIILLFIQSECGFCTICVSQLGDDPKPFTRRQDFCAKLA